LEKKPRGVASSECEEGAKGVPPKSREKKKKKKSRGDARNQDKKTIRKTKTLGFNRKVQKSKKPKKQALYHGGGQGGQEKQVNSAGKEVGGGWGGRRNENTIQGLKGGEEGRARGKGRAKGVQDTRL